MPVFPKQIVQKLSPYKGPSAGRLDYIRLDFGENTCGFPETYPHGLAPQKVSAYPEYEELLASLAVLYGVESGNILLTNGSDEAISLVANTFIEPGQDKAVVSKPCFQMVPHALLLAGAELVEVPVLADLSFDLAGIEKALSMKPKLAMFATPENPTGATIGSEVILEWCRRFPDTLIAVDEAYVEFSRVEPAAQPHALLKATTLDQYSNLLVMRTFSKAWAMAGLRLGFIVSNPTNLEWLQRVRLPYSVNSAAVATALKLVGESSKVLAGAETSVERKERLESELVARGYKLVRGQSNSFLLSLGINAQSVTDFLKERGLLVRNRSASVAPPGSIEKDQLTQADPLWGMVRVSTGSEDENQRLLELLDEFNSGYALLFDLDGTLVDTSTSFDATVDELVFRYSGGRLAPEELNCLRAEGGFNDDWVAAQELLRRRGIEVDFGKLSDEAFELYLSMAAANETAFFDEGLLQKAALKHPLFIVTGRTRREYEPVWASRLDASFKRVYCLDDLPDARPKPAPDFLLRARSDYRIRDGIYVGNSVDDMQAARQAGFYAIGVCTNLSAATLRESGADITVRNVNEIIEVLSL